MDCSLRQRFRGLFLGAAIGEQFPPSQASQTVWRNFAQLLLNYAQAWIGTSQRVELEASSNTPLGDFASETRTTAILTQILLLILMNHEAGPTLQMFTQYHRPFSLNVEVFSASEQEALQTLIDGLAACLLGQTVDLDQVRSCENYIDNVNGPSEHSSEPSNVAGLNATRSINSVSQSIHHLLTIKAPLAHIHQRFCQVDQSPLVTTIALSLYCWLSTPLVFETGVARSQHSNHPPLTGPLTGALLGATLGAHQIFSSYFYGARIAEPSHYSVLSSSLMQQLLTAADQLFLQWSGITVEDPTQLFASDPTLAIAAPGILKPRMERKNALTSWY